MQLVGATNTYIRLPFICEGLLDGLIGALVAVALLAVARATLWPRLLDAAAVGSTHGDPRGRARSRRATRRGRRRNRRRRVVGLRRAIPADVNIMRSRFAMLALSARTCSGARRSDRPTSSSASPNERAKAQANSGAAARQTRASLAYRRRCTTTTYSDS